MASRPQEENIPTLRKEILIAKLQDTTCYIVSQIKKSTSQNSIFAGEPKKLVALVKLFVFTTM